MWIYFRDEHNYVEKYPELFEAVPETRQPKPRGLNTLIDYFRKIRSFMIWCYDNDFTTNRPFDKYHIEEPVYGSPVYISLEERNQLLKHDFSDHPRLEKYRDIFVFHSLIGCRVSDLWSMTKKNVVGDHIEYIAGKTINNNPRTITVPLRKCLFFYRSIQHLKSLQRQILLLGNSIYAKKQKSAFLVIRPGWVCSMQHTEGLRLPCGLCLKLQT